MKKSMPKMPPKSELRNIFEEVDRDVGIRGLKDIEGREGEYGAGDDDARASSDRLDDDVLTEDILFFQCARHADGDNGDGNRGLEDLADLKTEVGSCGAEDDGENEAEGNGVGCHFSVIAGRMHHRTIGFVGSQFAECVVGHFHRVDVVRGRDGGRTIDFLG